MQKFTALTVAFLLLILLSACASPAAASDVCTVLFEDNSDVLLRTQVFDVTRGSDLTVTVNIPEGMRIASVNYEDALISPCTLDTGTRCEYRLTLLHIRYPLLVRLQLKTDRSTVYCFDDGGDAITVSESGLRLRANSLRWQTRCSRDGYLPIGWTVKETGQCVSFGSRMDSGSFDVLHLSCAYLPCSPESDFTYLITDDGSVITGYSGTGDLVIPETLGGASVTGIAAGAFGDIAVETAAFPPSLTVIESGAFASLCAEDLYLFDTLCEVSDSSFGTYSVTTLHINAAVSPVYCGSYFDTLSEKIDYLDSVKDSQKIILFCGSSARFGYDSALLEDAFPDYKVVNMGVYAYSNMLPQARLLEQYLRNGDIILSSPELDAIDVQFCGSDALDSAFFAMMESNYDMLAMLDMREYTGIFDAFGAYQVARQDMDPRTYEDIPAFYDEDGAEAPSLSYNRQGDYILYRASNLDGKLFGVKRASYNPADIREEDWDGLNRVYDSFAEKGAKIYFTWSPRSAHSITGDSTAESAAELEEACRSRLHASVISSVGDSLMDAYYFYGTDNHLTTEGAQLHTAQVIADLRQALAEVEE